jgi:hypothetical protein
MGRVDIHVHIQASMEIPADSVRNQKKKHQKKSIIPSAAGGPSTCKSPTWPERSLGDWQTVVIWLYLALYRRARLEPFGTTRHRVLVRSECTVHTVIRSVGLPKFSLIKTSAGHLHRQDREILSSQRGKGGLDAQGLSCYGKRLGLSNNCHSGSSVELSPPASAPQ